MENINQETLKDIVKCAKDIFCNGIYVPCREHPCGWDFISFEDVETEDVLKYCFDNYNISNGIYDSHPFEGMTLLEILEETKEKYAFEIGSIYW